MLNKLEKKAVAYLRCASKDQSREALERQHELIALYCAQQGICLVNEYFDEGFSGLTAERPALQNLIQDVKRDRDWDTILVCDRGRLFRTFSGFAYCRDLFRGHDVDLIYVAEELRNTDELMEHDLLTSVMGEIKSEYWED